MQKEKRYALNLPHPLPMLQQYIPTLQSVFQWLATVKLLIWFLCQPLLFKVSCPFWEKYNHCIEWGIYFVNALICTVFSCTLYSIFPYLASMKKTGNYTALGVLIINE